MNSSNSRDFVVTELRNRRSITNRYGPWTRSRYEPNISGTQDARHFSSTREWMCIDTVVGSCRCDMNHLRQPRVHLPLLVESEGDPSLSWSGTKRRVVICRHIPCRVVPVTGIPCVHDHLALNLRPVGSGCTNRKCARHTRPTDNAL